MSAKPRIPKSLEQRLQDCETHLYFLWDARRLYPAQEDRFKQIAAELRILVCETRTNHPLLLKLMEEFAFPFDVQPPGPPFDKQPITMVGWRDDPAHKQLTAEVQAAIGDEQKLSQVLQRQASLRRPVPFREYVEKSLAVFIAPYDYSYRELILAVAQQVGSSHEDLTVEEPLIKMQHVRLAGHQGHIAPLIVFTELVLEVGRLFVEFLVQTQNYEPRYYKQQHAEPGAAADGGGM
ncbi:hypothetical protein ETAA8_29510 [Anatilimnocola aggregata]|uniref:Uncharacterized protein n=1 Tax=Anatilimnocola aggregata TaxID=2528021 RepID=A0A517YC94_9BACT|nr:hypothetical protein [Anatilimnocola aggregata]QDU27860.1 hypothetical protein ETAA8_29510 [Anatilimnocola aggregata]